MFQTSFIQTETSSPGNRADQRGYGTFNLENDENVYSWIEWSVVHHTLHIREYCLDNLFGSADYIKGIDLKGTPAPIVSSVFFEKIAGSVYGSVLFADGTIYDVPSASSSRVFRDESKRVSSAKHVNTSRILICCEFDNIVLAEKCKETWNITSFSRPFSLSTKFWFGSNSTQEKVLTVEIFRDRNTLYGFTLHSEGILQLWDLTKMQHVYKFEGLLDVGEYAEDGKLCVCKQSEGSGFDPLRPSFCIGIGLCLDSSWKFFNAILGMNPREGSEPAFNLMRQREIFRTHLADLTFDSSNRVLLALWGDNFVTCLKLDGSSSAVETLEPSCAARLGASVLISALGLSVDHIMGYLLRDLFRLSRFPVSVLREEIKSWRRSLTDGLGRSEFPAAIRGNGNDFSLEEVDGLIHSVCDCLESRGLLESVDYIDEIVENFNILIADCQRHTCKVGMKACFLHSAVSSSESPIKVTICSPWGYSFVLAQSDPLFGGGIDESMCDVGRVMSNLSEYLLGLENREVIFTIAVEAALYGSSFSVENCEMILDLFLEKVMDSMSTECFVELSSRLQSCLTEGTLRHWVESLTEPWLRSSVVAAQLHHSQTPVPRGANSKLVKGYLARQTLKDRRHASLVSLVSVGLLAKSRQLAPLLPHHLVSVVAEYFRKAVFQYFYISYLEWLHEVRPCQKTDIGDLSCPNFDPILEHSTLNYSSSLADNYLHSIAVHPTWTLAEYFVSMSPATFSPFTKFLLCANQFVAIRRLGILINWFNHIERESGVLGDLIVSRGRSLLAFSNYVQTLNMCKDEPGHDHERLISACDEILRARPAIHLDEDLVLSDCAGSSGDAVDIVHKLRKSSVSTYFASPGHSDIDTAAYLLQIDSHQLLLHACISHLLDSIELFRRTQHLPSNITSCMCQAATRELLSVLYSFGSTGSDDLLGSPGPGSLLFTVAWEKLFVFALESLDLPAALSAVKNLRAIGEFLPQTATVDSSLFGGNHQPNVCKWGDCLERLVSYACSQGRLGWLCTLPVDPEADWKIRIDEALQTLSSSYDVEVGRTHVNFSECLAVYRLCSGDYQAYAEAINELQSKLQKVTDRKMFPSKWSLSCLYHAVSVSRHEALVPTSGSGAADDFKVAREILLQMSHVLTGESQACICDKLALKNSLKNLLARGRFADAVSLGQQYLRVYCSMELLCPAIGALTHAAISGQIPLSNRKVQMERLIQPIKEFEVLSASGQVSSIGPSTLWRILVDALMRLDSPAFNWILHQVVFSIIVDRDVDVPNCVHADVLRAKGTVPPSRKLLLHSLIARNKLSEACTVAVAIVNEKRDAYEAGRVESFGSQQSDGLPYNVFDSLLAGGHPDSKKLENALESYFSLTAAWTY